MKKTTARGFTLVELLIVIAIIAILAAVVVLIINPLELTKRSRDAARLTDLANMQQAINVAAQEATNSGTDILCYGGGMTGTPPTCNGDSNPTSDANRSSLGTGWVKVNLLAQKSVYTPILPIDPINNATNHYTYRSDGTNWEINAVLESDSQAKKMSENDGGSNAAVYEVGSDLTLIP